MPYLLAAILALFALATVRYLFEKLSTVRSNERRACRWRDRK